MSSQSKFQTTKFNGDITITSGNTLTLSDNAIVNSDSGSDAIATITGLRTELDALANLDQTDTINNLKAFQLNLMSQNGLKTFTGIDLSNGTSDAENAASLANISTLNNADFTGSDFENVNFSGSNVSGSDFTNSTLTSANFTNTNLFGADLINTSITGATFSQTNAFNVTGKTVNVSTVSGEAFGTFSPALSALNTGESITMIETNSDGTVIIYLLIDGNDSNSQHLIRKVLVNGSWITTHDKNDITYSSLSPITSIATSSDGLIFAIGIASSNGVYVYRLTSLSSDSTTSINLTGNDNFGTNVALNDDGSFIAVGTPSWNTNNGRVLTYEWSGSAYGNELSIENQSSLSSSQFGGGYKIMLKTINSILCLFATFGGSSGQANRLDSFYYNSTSWNNGGSNGSGGRSFFSISNNGNIVVEDDSFTGRTIFRHTSFDGNTLSSNTNGFSKTNDNIDYPIGTFAHLIGNGNNIVVIIPEGNSNAGIYIRQWNNSIGSHVHVSLSYTNSITNYGNVSAVTDQGNKIILAGNAYIDITELYSYLT